MNMRPTRLVTVNSSRDAERTAEPFNFPSRPERKVTSHSGDAKEFDGKNKRNDCDRCHKCKKLGHLAKMCPIASRQRRVARARQLLKSATGKSSDEAELLVSLCDLQQTPLDRSAAPLDVARHNIPPSENPDRRPCKYFMMGKCNRGEECKYSHVRQPQHIPPANRKAGKVPPKDNTHIGNAHKHSDTDDDRDTDDDSYTPRRWQPTSPSGPQPSFSTNPPFSPPSSPYPNSPVSSDSDSQSDDSADEATDELYDNVLDKIRGRLLDADLNCLKMGRTTRISAINIVRKECGYENGANVLDIVTRAYAQAQEEVLDFRELAAFRRVKAGKQRENLSFNTFMQLRCQLFTRRTQWERVKYLENLPVGSGVPTWRAPVVNIITTLAETVLVQGLSRLLARWSYSKIPNLPSTTTSYVATLESHKEVLSFDYLDEVTSEAYVVADPACVDVTVDTPIMGIQPTWVKTAVLIGSFFAVGVGFSIFESVIRRRRLSAYRMSVHGSNAITHCFSPLRAVILNFGAHMFSNVICGLIDRPDLMACVVEDVCLEDKVTKTIETQDGYVVSKREATCNSKFGLRRLWGLRDWVPTVFRNCHHNEKVAMDGRVGKKLPIHDSATAMRRCSAEWSKLTKRVIPLFQRIHRVTHGLPFQEWVQSFPPGKRLIFSELNNHPEDDWGNKASSFIKREKAIRNGTYTDGEYLPNTPCVWKDPRFIQGCPLYLSLRAGPYIRRYTKHLRNHLRPSRFTTAEVRRGQQVVYTCGLSSEDVGNSLKMAIDTISAMCPVGDQVVFLEDDQSRFDLHMLEGAFRFLDTVYQSALPRKIRRMLRRTKRSRGVSSLGTRYSIPYTMQSGWPDTSGGDTTINAGMKHYIHGTGRPWIAIINGDDSLMVTLRSELARLGGLAGIDDSYAKLGMEVTSFVTTDVTEAEFCSGVFRPVQGTYVLFPKVGNLLTKMLYDDKDRTPVQQLAWMRGIAATLRHFGHYDPLCLALSRGIDSITGEGDVIEDVLNPYKNWPSGDLSPDPIDTAQFYLDRYGLHIRDIEEACDVLSHIELNGECNCAILQWIAEVEQMDRTTSRKLQVHLSGPTS